MAVRIADTLGTMGEGGYPLVKAVDVQMTDGKTVEVAIGEAEAIAKGKSKGYVFDTVEALDAWLAVAENVAKLNLGDNLYIRAVNVPDYWWDGTQKQQLETQKVDLTNYYTKDDVYNKTETYTREEVENLIEESGGGYTLPKATAETLGGIKVGSGLSMDEDGVLSTEGGGGTSDYEDLSNKPSINGVTVEGAQTSADLGLKEVHVGSDQPSDVNVKMWVDTSVGSAKKYTGDVYSTEETVIGTWIDGKPLYRKVIDFGALPNNTTKAVAYNIDDLGYVVDIRAMSLNTAYILPIPLAYSSYVSIWVNLSNKCIEITTISDRSSYTETKVFLEYTKTTD